MLSIKMAELHKMQQGLFVVRHASPHRARADNIDSDNRVLDDIVTSSTRTAKDYFPQKQHLLFRDTLKYLTAEVSTILTWKL